MRRSLERVLRHDTASTPVDRLADPPERVGAPAAGVILTATAVFAWLAVTGLRPPGTPGAGLAAGVGLVGLAAALRSPPALHVTVLCALAALAHQLPGTGTHPFPLGTGLAAYLVVVAARRELRESTRWLHSGATDATVVRHGALVAVAAGVALVGWYVTNAPLVPESRMTLVDLPAVALPFIAVFFAVVNAGVEELVFRGVLLDGLRSAAGDVAGVVVQAVAFGMVHLAAGVPDGPDGAVLAGLYGLALGVLRLRARGLLAVWAIHASTDLVIFLIILLDGPRPGG